MFDLCQGLLYCQTSFAMKAYLFDKPLFKAWMLTALNGAIDRLHTMPYPLSLFAEVTKNTECIHIHSIQNCSGDELMRSGDNRIVTSPGAMATKSA